jgi:hypothetical protein
MLAIRQIDGIAHSLVQVMPDKPCRQVLVIAQAVTLEDELIAFGIKINDAEAKVDSKKEDGNE